MICPTLAILYKRGERSCRTVTSATPVIIDAIIPCKRTDPDWGYESPHARLHAADGSWSGFTDVGNLQPTVPVGTLLAMQGDTLWRDPLVLENDSGKRIAIGYSAMAKLLRYDPKRAASLYVRILSGPYRDRIGWMFIQSADTGGVALGEYDLQYPYKTCQPEMPWWS